MQESDSGNSTKSDEPYKLKSQKSTDPVRLFIHNQSERNVDVIWLNYKGDEVKFRELSPKRQYVVKTYLTHPWIFRDSAARNLVPIDALVAGRPDLFALHARKFRRFEIRRFLSGSRIFLPISYEGNYFIMVIIKNGVFTLQENCMNKLINYTADKVSLVSRYLPSNLRNYFEAYIKGQDFREFIDTHG